VSTLQAQATHFVLSLQYMIATALQDTHLQLGLAIAVGKSVISTMLMGVAQARSPHAVTLRPQVLLEGTSCWVQVG
jgi:hypothetical protein